MNITSAPPPDFGFDLSPAAVKFLKKRGLDPANPKAVLLGILGNERRWPSLRTPKQRAIRREIGFWMIHHPASLFGPQLALRLTHGDDLWFSLHQSKA